MGRTLKQCLAWSGLVFAAFFVVGWLGVVHWVPPPAPSSTADVTAARYRDRTDQIRLGFLIVFLGQIAFPMFGAAIAAQTRRIRQAPRALSYAQLVALGCANMAMVGPITIFFVAAFRPERAPETTQLLNDIAWLSFMVAFPPFVAWAFAIGMAILCDTSAEPIYPRWSGYFCVFVGIIQMPAGALVFFKTGPFAWNGLFPFWLPAGVFFGWIVAMSCLTAAASRTPDPADDPVRTGEAIESLQRA
jgi:hypothetical protein